jgi:methylglutaconyl-CoA hydratase
MNAIVTALHPHGVARVRLNRPEATNAFNDAMIASLHETFVRLGADAGVRVVILEGEGKHFSAGGDLAWMRRMASYSQAENEADAMGLAGMLRALNAMPKPTIALIQGYCFAGAVGLAAACDIAIAEEGAVFALTEVRLGLIPATIGPYVAAAIGMRACRRYVLTAERFGAAKALELGLVHEVVGKGELAAAGAAMTGHLLAGGPQAQAAAKRLLADIAHRPIDDPLMAETARAIASARASEEGREGLASFFDKRKPGWAP